jgi:uncharacterized sulfatase
MRKPNIVLITADSLRYDHLRCCSGTNPTFTPHIDLFAQRSCVYLNAYSGGPNTPHAFPGIMAGRNALDSSKLGLFEDKLTLAQALKTAGYTTLAFSAANPYISRHFHYHRGFDYFEDFVDFELDHEMANETGDLIGIPQADLEQYLMSEENLRKKESLERSFNQEIAQVIPDARPPFFLWVHYMDTHYPYVPAIGFQKMSSVSDISKEGNFQLNRIVRENLTPSPAQSNEIKKLYTACVRQLDTQVGNLLSNLSANGEIDNSILLFCADHGEEFRDHGDFQHKSKLFEELIHAPLMLKRPEEPGAGVVERPVSLAGIPETIMSLAGERDVFGTPALDAGTNADSLTYSAASIAPNGNTPSDGDMMNINPLPKIVSIRKGHWKFIFRKGHTHMLFNLFRDPGESRNLVSEENARAAELTRVATSLLAEFEETRLSKRLSGIRDQIKTENALHVSY